MKNINTNKLNYTIMKKTIIASKELEKLGLEQVILTLDTSECTISLKTYYNGNISRRETNYYENDYILNTSWETLREYYQENGYVMITM